MSERDSRELVERWVALAGEETRGIGADLVARYGEPHRRYHTRDHLTAVLDLVDELAAYADDPDAVRLAVWFHDAVYDPERGDNEERSAVKAERVLADTDLPPATIAEVARLVRLTAAHDPGPGDRNGQVLCDADLAILAADPEKYAAYTAAVREEYAFVPDEYFTTARADILRSLLALPALFHTPPARERFEQQARHNLQTELMLLEAGSPRP
ncbi:Predicted metal-dependent phosphohydrolase, HD superfamily [Thermomonospora echinospora]|uniref:Predicted metal-dependent phosphohydrolase, HD superfamily n=1 Tax=Thermomonospora echinospora TaxID=1992 RepID=A0A1H5VBC5_9ACTN|nr:metal-dependent phosphohydrolase [Thermomonospora echinospora]SEF84672.1 Predicted metal-dependent phosphohydrolase, HD superfamily [Thermomonospora echinospora]